MSKPKVKTETANTTTQLSNSDISDIAETMIMNGNLEIAGIDPNKAGKTIFEQNYAALSLQKKQLRGPLVKSQLERAFLAAIDDLEDQIITQQMRVLEQEQSIETFDINVIIEAASIIKEAKEAQAAVRGQYKRLFGTSIPSLNRMETNETETAE